MHVIVSRATVDEYTRRGWWGTNTLSERIAALARDQADATAFLVEGHASTWADYDARATEIARMLVGAGLERGDRVAVVVPDGLDVHAAFVGAERAGLVVVGIGERAGVAEISHLVGRTNARAVVTSPTVHREDAQEVVDRIGTDRPELGAHVILDGPRIAVERPATGTRRRTELAIEAAPESALQGRALGPNDLFLVNSTSGTTGLPKCVMQFQNRWVYFHQLAREAGELSPDDVFMSLVPAPYGFGLWTQHFTPTLLGAPTVLLPRFDAGRALLAAAEGVVTVLSCVSTQFIMMLNAPEMGSVDLSGLRVMFTGGEAVPFHAAADFEDRTGALVLQFFGSNETGAFSVTTTKDDRDHRLRTAGRCIPDMQVRLFDDEGVDVTASGGPGQPGGRGAATCAGYYDDEAANRELVNDDGWMLMADVVEIDDEGYLRVVGRKADIVIRGGRNISAAQVEDEVGTDPSVDQVAVVALPDAVYGERVCAVVVPVPGREVTLESVVAHLRARGVSPELMPERLVLLDDLPRASGGKVAKGQLRELVVSLTIEERI
jgi:acyl-CoA synthetase